MSRLPLLLPAVLRCHRTAASAVPGTAHAAACSAESTPGAGRRRAAWVAAHVAIVLLMVSVPAAAYADVGAASILAADAPKNLQTVIGNLQTWLMGILAALATLFLVLAGVYWATAGGDPAQVDKAKQALKNALVGYGLAVLAPLLLEIVKGIVGG